MGALIVAAIALAVAALALAVALGVAVRINRLETVVTPDLGGLAVGTPVPETLLEQAPSDERTDWIRGPTVLAFLSSGCKACGELLERLNEAGSLDVRLVFVEQETDARLHSEARFGVTWLTDPDGGLRRAFRVVASPHLYLIEKGVIIAQEVGTDVHSLAARGRGRSATAVS